MGGREIEDRVGTQYEYANVRIEGDFVTGLNQLGAQGWQAWWVLNAEPGKFEIAIRRVKSRIVVPNGALPKTAGTQ